MPNQQINYKIKDVYENAGIHKLVSITKTIGGQKTTKKDFKFDLVKPKLLADHFAPMHI